MKNNTINEGGGVMRKKIKKSKYKHTQDERKLLLKTAVKRMHRYLNKSEWKVKFGWADYDFGSCNPSRKTLYINPYRSVVNTFIHEYLHSVYPEMSHEKIYTLELDIYDNLSPRKMKNLAKKIMLGRKITMKDFETIPDD